MLYHSGARNYSCELCGNKFFQMEHLKRHMHSIHFIAAVPTVLPDNNSKRSNKKQLKASSLNPAIKPRPRNPLSKKVPLNEQTKQSQQSFKITSRCMYKCQQCDFSTLKLYNLNEHAIKSHSRQSNPNDEHFDLEDQLEDEQNDEDESSDDDEEEGENQDQDEYICSFCAFKSDKKIRLKRHLNCRHSSQVTAPILLQNDPIILNCNTRFQCSVCRFLLPTLNEYIKHMSEKHSVQVFIVDSNESTSTQVRVLT